MNNSAERAFAPSGNFHYLLPQSGCCELETFICHYLDAGFSVAQQNLCQLFLQCLKWVCEPVHKSASYAVNFLYSAILWSPSYHL